ncbi:hypothetical protein R1A27_20225 [Methylobacterium sp. NMS12]|uniref:hypothetical protein n=1 Tax=Methylobacterium sp. NMS12 TaxID=3079766 RepID=UPI003F880E18
MASVWAITVEEFWLFALFAFLVGIVALIDLAVGGSAIRRATKAELDTRASSSHGGS